MAEQSVTLNPGESKAVSFEAVPHEARTYQVVVDGLMGSFSATVGPMQVIDAPERTTIPCATAFRLYDAIERRDWVELLLKPEYLYADTERFRGQYESVIDFLTKFYDTPGYEYGAPTADVIKQYLTHEGWIALWRYGYWKGDAGPILRGCSR